MKFGTNIYSLRQISITFLPRNALQCKVRSCDRMSSARPSVCLSVTLVICDHISWKSWKLIARTISPTPSLFVAKRHPPTPRGTWRNLGETRSGVGKTGVLEHKSANISETRKDRGQVTMDGLQNLTNAMSDGTIGTKAYKIWRKVAVSVVRESRKFSGHPYIGVIFAIAQL